MKKLTPQELKQFVEKEENIKVMQSLFEAIAFSETITEIVEKKSTEILAFYKFESKEVSFPNGRVIPSEVILEHKHVFQLEDADFNLYFSEMKAFYNSDQCPIKPKKEDNCPALESQSLVREIKIAIADLFEPTLGISYDQISGSLQYYKTYYDLILTMFAPHVKKLKATV